MSLKECVQWLLDNGYGVMINNQFVTTSKLNQELTGSSVITSVPLTTIKVTNEDERKVVWNAFISDAEIPHRVNSGTMVYTVRQYNKPAVDKLIKIMKTPGIDYKKFVDSTKHYYKTVTSKTTLSNYLLRDIWKDEYDHYKGPQQQIANGENRFED